MWTEQQEKYLEREYSRTPNKILAEQLDKSESAVKSKARRMSLEKDRKQSRLFETRESNAVWPTGEINHQFVVGLSVGEGSFNYTETDDRTKFRFKIEMIEDERPLLEEVKDFFGVGRLYSYDREEKNQQATISYVVSDADSIARVIIPFFSEIGLRNSTKQDQFNEFKDEFHSYFGLEPKQLSTDSPY